MTTHLQDLSFGDFSGLSQEEQERVLNILHRPKDSTDRKVEFPWDGVEGSPPEASVRYFSEYATGGGYPQHMNMYAHPPPPGMFVPDPRMSAPPGFSMPPHDIQYNMSDMQFGFMHNDPIPMDAMNQESNDYLQQENDDKSGSDNSQSASSSQSSRLQASMKNYERRNKKRRPADYYTGPHGGSDGSDRRESYDESFSNQPQYDGSMQDYIVSSGQNRVPDIPTEMKFHSEMQMQVTNSQGGAGAHQPTGMNYVMHGHPPPGMERMVSPIQQHYNQQPVHVHSLPTRNVYPQTFVQAPVLVSPQVKTGNEELSEVVVESVPQQDMRHIQMSQHQQMERNNFNTANHPVVNAGPPQSFSESPAQYVPQNTTAEALVRNNVENVPERVVNNTVSVPRHEEHTSENLKTYTAPDSHMYKSVTSSGQTNSKASPLAESNSVSKHLNTTDLGAISMETSGTTHIENPPVVSVSNSVDSSNIQTVADGASGTPTTATVSTSANVEIKVQEAPIAKSWAGLFKSGGAASGGSSVVGVRTVSVTREVPIETVKKDSGRLDREVSPPVPATEDSQARYLGDLLSRITITHSSMALQPRGLINRANWCYINGTLQALIACPPFYNLLKKLPKYPALSRGPSSTPILDAIVQFVNEFEPMARVTERGSNRRGGRDVISGPAFEPSYVYKMLQVIAVNPHFKLGKQEDAEEFLSCILDGMHEEMSSALKLLSNNHKTEEAEEAVDGYTNGFIQADGEDAEEEEVAEDSWEQVGPKKKSVLTRRANFAKTPIADIFAGMVRSAVYKATAKETATLQPFFTLQLDIQSEKVSSVREALDCLVSKESIEYTCAKTKEEVEVVKKSSLEELPPVLILHLKFFVYNKDGGSQKLMKKVDYPVDLEITKELLSPNARNKLNLQQRSYKLFAVVYHHGKAATGGHYTTSVFHPGINGWVNSDDSIIRTVPASQVLKFIPPRAPYLLYYRRLDSH